ncbi:MAG: hypothetical protein M3495_06430 [Pseudomonadota bacterium]|nr:hypothetical protein [Pseudomonadota bacterium]
MWSDPSRTPAALAARCDPIDHHLGVREETDLHELGPDGDELALGRVDIGDAAGITRRLQKLRTLVGDHIQLGAQAVLRADELPVTRRAGAPLFLSQIDPGAV